MAPSNDGHVPFGRNRQSSPGWRVPRTPGATQNAPGASLSAAALPASKRGCNAAERSTDQADPVLVPSAQYTCARRRRSTRFRGRWSTFGAPVNKPTGVLLVPGRAWPRRPRRMSRPKTKTDVQRIDPRSAHARPPFKQTGNGTGDSDALAPPPDHGESSYVGSGRLAGLRAVITGGDSGIGRAVAIAFAREGADVLIVYRDEADDAADTVRLVEEAGRRGSPSLPTSATKRAAGHWSSAPPTTSVGSTFWSTTPQRSAPATVSRTSRPTIGSSPFERI